VEFEETYLKQNYHKLAELSLFGIHGFEIIRTILPVIKNKVLFHISEFVDIFDYKLVSTIKMIDMEGLFLKKKI
jgi:hypothetical protein